LFYRFLVNLNRPFVSFANGFHGNITKHETNIASVELLCFPLWYIIEDGIKHSV